MQGAMNYMTTKLNNVRVSFSKELVCIIDGCISNVLSLVQICHSGLSRIFLPEGLPILPLIGRRSHSKRDVMRTLLIQE